VTSPADSAAREGRTPLERVLPVALALLALSQLVLFIWMVAAPGSFFDHIGAFGSRNDHYIRDVATWELALAVTAGVAVVRRSWRVPVLAFAVVQFAAHAANHVADAGDAHASTSGWGDAIELAVVAVVLAALLGAAMREARRS
jgi:hypothetical protein